MAIPILTQIVRCVASVIVKRKIKQIGKNTGKKSVEYVIKQVGKNCKGQNIVGGRNFFKQNPSEYFYNRGGGDMKDIIEANLQLQNNAQQQIRTYYLYIQSSGNIPKANIFKLGL